MLHRVAVLAGVFAAVVIGVPRVSEAAPGATLTAERARLAHLEGLAPLQRTAGDPTRYMTTADNWALTLIVGSGIVTSEMLSVSTQGQPYDIFADGRKLAARLLTAPVAADFASSTIVTSRQQDPDIREVFRRGVMFAYRTVDDRRNSIHAVEIMPLPVAAAGDAIFSVGSSGRLEPVALHANGRFLPLTAAPKAKLIHVIFGNQLAGTVAIETENGGATIPIPPALHLGEFVSALASPTLGANAASSRRAPLAAERSGALALAAAKLGTTPGHLDVRNLAAIDLGHGISIAGTVNLRGSSQPRVDHRLFFIAEPNGGSWALTLANVQTITVTEPLLEEPAEYLIDALNLGGGTVGLVTRVIGYDASSFAIYTRNGATWKRAFTGGGAAN